MELSLAGSDQSVAVSDSVFDRPFNEPLVHQVVTAYLAGARTGTKSQKSRADVRGGGKKPWRQKGTGRARAGTIRSPIWSGGGVTFASRPRDFSQKINRKMYRAGMRAIVSELRRRDRLVVVSNLTLDGRSTKGLIKALADRDCKPIGLLVVSAVDDNVRYSANNIPSLDILSASALSPVALVGADQVMITEDALKAIDGWLA